MIKLPNCILIICTTFLLSFDLSAQDIENDKGNNIFYVEFFSGVFLGNDSGFLLGGEINYQKKKNLFSLRYSKLEDIDITWFLLPYKAMNGNELAALYGRRFIKNGHSTSISIGPSYTFYVHMPEADDSRKAHAFGAAFEANIKWFQDEKKEPFGLSYGFKLTGNISKTYYIGLALHFSLGWHKNYLAQ